MVVRLYIARHAPRWIASQKQSERGCYHGCSRLRAQFEQVRALALHKDLVAIYVARGFNAVLVRQWACRLYLAAYENSLRLHHRTAGYERVRTVAFCLDCVTIYVPRRLQHSAYGYEQLEYCRLGTGCKAHSFACGGGVVTRRTCVHAHRNMYTIARIGSRRCCGFFITIHLSDDALAARACYITLAMLDAVPTLGQFFLCTSPQGGVCRC